MSDNVLRCCTLFDFKDAKKFVKMISSSANFLSSIVIDGSLVGIVEFNERAVKLQELITVTSDADRAELLEALPTMLMDGQLSAMVF